MANPNMVEISLKEYCELTMARDMLEALEAGGVDNWDGYDFAMEALNLSPEEEED